MTHPQVALGAIATLIRGITYKPSDVCEATTLSAVACMRTKNVQEDLDESDIVWIPASIIRNSADAPAHQLVALDQLQHFRIAGHRRCRQALQQLQELLAIAQIAAGQFADHPGMDQRLTLLQEPGETGQATAQMLHPG